MKDAACRRVEKRDASAPSAPSREVREVGDWGRNARDRDEGTRRAAGGNGEEREREGERERGEPQENEEAPRIQRI